MAITVRKPRVGQLVYMSFDSQNPGVIRSIETNGDVTVEWLPSRKKRPKIQTMSLTGLRDLQALIDDHEKKLKGHTARAAALRAIC